MYIIVIIVDNQQQLDQHMGVVQETSHDVAIIAGWLGCRAPSLRRYEELYESAGFHVIQIIPSAVAVVEATFRDPREMDDLALNLLQKLVKIRPSKIIFHAFSNGGGFLWQSFRNIMETNSQACTCINIVGAVFESSPAWFGEDSSILQAALEHCSIDEKKEVATRIGSWVYTREGMDEPCRRKKRNSEYFAALKDDSLDIAQLYINSTNDPLADSGKIQELVQSRIRKCSSPVILKQWSGAVHCTHILKHPAEYSNIIKTFCKTTLHRASL